MQPTGTGWTVHETRRHAAAAVAACCVSLIAHVIFVVTVPEIRMNVSGLRRPAIRHRTGTFRVSEAMPVPIEGRTPLQHALGDAAPVVVPDARVVAPDLLRGTDPARVEPRPLQGHEPMGDHSAIAGPEPHPASAWQPRQEILMIERPVVADEVAAIPRRRVPVIERVTPAEDVVLAFDGRPGAGAVGAPSVAIPAPPEIPIAESPVQPGTAVEPEVRPETIPQADVPDGTFAEEPAMATDTKPIEEGLTARLSVRETFFDRSFGYFRIDIQRLGPDVLPVMAKDVLLVQDCSASMTEQKLHFCREGLLRGLYALGEEDRFNVMQFHEKGTFLSPDWLASTAANRDKATSFIRAMRAEGNTDIFASLRGVLDLPFSKERPVVCLLVTDGQPTVGETDSSEIIGKFTKLNQGRVSVFTLGTVATANSYLLDLVSYCNRGDTMTVSRGRWEIPDSLHERVRSTSRLVLNDVRFTFAQDSPCEVFPVQTSNLYLDKSLVLYGRYPKGTDEVIFRAAGEGRDSRCDMIFRLPVREGNTSSDEDLRTEWARQKIYHLIGRYARTGETELLRSIRETSRAYRVSVPHVGSF